MMGSQISCFPHRQCSSFAKQDGVSILKCSSFHFVFVGFKPQRVCFFMYWKKCLCVEQISLISCSGAGLGSTPQTKKRMANYATLPLRDKLLLEVNFTLLMEQFPDLKTMDIRNNPIYCEGLDTGGPPKVITDCKTSKPTTHHRISANIISSTTGSILIHNLTQSFNIINYTVKVHWFVFLSDNVLRTLHFCRVNIHNFSVIIFVNFQATEIVVHKDHNKDHSIQVCSYLHNFRVPKYEI